MSLNNTYFESKGRDISVPIPDSPGYTPPTPPTPPTPGSGSDPVIPRPSFSGNVSCTLYVNSSEIIALDKNLSSVMSCTLALKEDVDIESPVVYINTSTDLTSCNYMKIEDRYYFAHVELQPGGSVYKVVGNTDPLMTFRSAIRDQIGIIGRNQNSYNRFLQDNRVKLNAYEQVKTLEFPSGFSKTMQYYLIAIGGDDE